LPCSDIYQYVLICQPFTPLAPRIRSALATSHEVARVSAPRCIPVGTSPRCQDAAPARETNAVGNRVDSCDSAAAGDERTSLVAVTPSTKLKGLGFHGVSKVPVLSFLRCEDHHSRPVVPGTLYLRWSLGGRMRRARLKKKFGSLYPELPADHWIPAWQASMRRAERVWGEAGPEALIEGRLLPNEHFEFHGGSARPPGWYPTPERLSDPARSNRATTGGP
jgi:hypothetical protein